MALGIIHITFAIVSLIGMICAFTLLHRYIKSRNILAVSFFAFLFSLGIATFMYFVRGFYAVGSPEDILLWQGSNMMYVAMALPLVTFLLYPVYIQRKEKGKGMEILVVMAAFVIASIFDLIVMATAEIVPTYVDIYGLSHYTMESFFPSAYALVLGILIIMGLVATGLLGIAAYKEADTFYRRRALLLMIGWILCMAGQLFLLTPSLSIANPAFTIPGTLIIAVGIIRTPSS